IGLLIGIERERRKGEGPARAAAGLRTFTLASLLGALAMLLGGGATLAVLAAVVGALAIVSYRRSRDDDPGLTTEIALVLTFMLGALA
ncbi:MgtC/SapB family protein, partial [Salmonella enterica subsp. enterica serovar Typhimurium]|nr:MgtC/SapB family protein [Salmonella enterica subsp. enterica serovar Typhimurium]